MKVKEKLGDNQNKKQKWWTKALGLTALVLLVMAAGTYIMFREELKITNSIRPLAERKNVYYMEVYSDYHFEEFLESGGASSDSEVSAFLTNCISKGFYQVDVTNEGSACSVISALDSENSHVWGRNFDWDGSVPIIVKCVPKKGYASISTCDFKNITNSPDAAPDNFINKMLAIAAVYVPMDGINEAGLCVADLEVNEGGMIEADTEKPDLTITTAIRLVLNRASTVDEALNLLKQYDIHASGGISHHLAISDASGTSVSVEFVDGEMMVVDTDCITNFNLANGDTAAGGESAQKRYELLCAVHEKNNGILSGEQVKGVLSQVSKKEGEWRTQWSVVYQQEIQMADYYFGGAYENGISFSAAK
ncbi:MAG: linear amide C-N hydrolase [Lachnospiraceae bacterium]|nr:linear amide C-N hydrolase [Lachnospiraceae bacterium]